MSRKVAVAVIHGIGSQPKNFGDRVCAGIQKRTHAICGEDIITRSVHWAPILQSVEEEFSSKVRLGGKMRLVQLRKYVIDLLGDAVAYQPIPGSRATYDTIHGVFANTLKSLAAEAGEDAPLCVVAHSLGSVIASNFIYDLQTDARRPIISDLVRDQMRNTPLERGETLSLFYTLGSPLALFTLRYDKFGKPIEMPPPQLHQHHPGLFSEWVNFYDADDVIGFPLRKLSDAYEQAVTEDRQVNVGRIYEFWNPLSHLRYWTDNVVLDPIAKSLVRVWKEVNAVSPPAV